MASESPAGKSGLKRLAKRVLRVLFFPVLRYFGPRFHNLMVRQDQLARQLASLANRSDESLRRHNEALRRLNTLLQAVAASRDQMIGRLDEFAQSQNARFDQMEYKLYAEVETMMELLVIAQRAGFRPALPGARRFLSPGEQEPIGEKSLGHCKVCNLEDFSHPEMVGVLREVFSHEVERLGSQFPIGFEFRKHWEVAMAVRSLADFGALHDRAEILGVGAGNEPTVFYLTNFVHRVFATDLYLEPGIWKDFADTAMLLDPGRYWPSQWNPRRLVIQHMNGMELQYEDCSFDGIFSSSSVEHFGNLDDVERSMDEMYRVLKPGGILSLSTEYRIEGDLMGIENALMFSGNELTELLVGERDWALVTPLDTTLSGMTLAGEKPHENFMTDFLAHLEGRGTVFYHELDINNFPQIVMRSGPNVWTSVHLALRKGFGRGALGRL